MHEEKKQNYKFAWPVTSDTASMHHCEDIRYTIITPVRDEEAFISDMIESVGAQTKLPNQWIIVDDGSTDRTPEIILHYAEQYQFIQLIQLPPRTSRLPGGEGAIPTALKHVNLGELDFLARFDADLILSPTYIAGILKKFHNQPKLGIAGGGLYIDKDGSLLLEDDKEIHVRGALKMYRRECYLDIGGLTHRIGWDTLDEAAAWSKGWTTRSFPEIPAIHRRPTGEGIASYRVYAQRGRAEYLTWSAPLFVLGKSVKTLISKKSLIKPICFLWGYFKTSIKRESRVNDPALARVRRAQQRSEMHKAFRRPASLFRSKNSA